MIIKYSEIHDHPGGLFRLTFVVSEERSRIFPLMEKVKEGEWELDIKPKTKKRSMDANAYYWSLAEQLAKVLRTSVKEIHQKMLEDYVQDIMSRERGITKTYKGHWPRINSNVLGAAFVKWLITDKPFWVDEEKCISCGTCASVCPVADIKGGTGMKPEWTHNGKCLTCFNCYHHCPTHAIEYGKRTKNKGQYYFK